jgi:hypothetical protein
LASSLSPTVLTIASKRSDRGFFVVLISLAP